MNPALALEPRTKAPIGLGELLAFLGLPSNRSVKDLPGTGAEAFKGLTGLIDELLSRTIDQRTKAAFESTRDKVFGDYFWAVKTLSRLARIVVPEGVISRLVEESFSELEADLRDQGTIRFGTPAKEQALHCVWTLRRTSGLISKIHYAGKPPSELEQQDAALASRFAFYASWTNFHLDCLVAAIRLDKPIHPDVLPEIIDGMRAAVNAYGLIRQGVDLRFPPVEEPSFSAPQWDAEDQELLDSSMHDLAKEILDDDPSWGTQDSRPAEVVPSAISLESSVKPSRVFGTHVREGIEIVKDWIEHPKPKE
jgi:hypothetical protein